MRARESTLTNKQIQTHARALSLFLFTVAAPSDVEKLVYVTNLKPHYAQQLLNAGGSSNDGASQRFLQEARAASLVRHRNIVDVFAFGQLGLVGAQGGDLVVVGLDLGGGGFVLRGACAVCCSSGGRAKQTST